MSSFISGLSEGKTTTKAPSEAVKPSPSSARCLQPPAAPQGAAAAALPPQPPPARPHLALPAGARPRVRHGGGGHPERLHASWQGRERRRREGGRAGRRLRARNLPGPPHRPAPSHRHLPAGSGGTRVGTGRGQGHRDAHGDTHGDMGTHTGTRGAAAGPCRERPGKGEEPPGSLGDRTNSDHKWSCGVKFAWSEEIMKIRGGKIKSLSVQIDLVLIP